MEEEETRQDQGPEPVWIMEGGRRGRLRADDGTLSARASAMEE